MSSPLSRRAALGLTAATIVPGCTVLSSTDSEDDGHSDDRNVREVIATNRRSAVVTLAVHIEYESAETPFSAVYRLEPDEYDSALELKGVPRSVTAFTADGMRRTWNYESPIKLNCDAPDVELVVEASDIQLNKPC